MPAKPKSLPDVRSSPEIVSAARFFEAIAGRYERAYALPRDASKARMQRVLAHLSHRSHVSHCAPRPRVLDLGVGTGRELSALQDAEYVVVGLDASEAMLKRCALRARPIEIVRGDFWSKLPFAAGSFDAVIALHGALAHPEDDEAMARLAREVHRVLRPSGAWIAEVPSPSWLARLPAAVDDDADLHVRRVGEDRFLHEDRVVGLAVEGTVYTEARWRALVGAQFTLSFEPLSDAEHLVVARRVG